MHITARADYAMRALLVLAAAPPGELVKGEDLAESQALPQRFLENIMIQLRRAGIVVSQRGADGGYGLARPAGEINAAEVLRAVEGPLAHVRGTRPEATLYEGAARNLQEVWVAVRASIRAVLEEVTLRDIVDGPLPDAVLRLTAAPEAWLPH